MLFVKRLEVIFILGAIISVLLLLLLLLFDTFMPKTLHFLGRPPFE